MTMRTTAYADEMEKIALKTRRIKQLLAKASPKDDSAREYLEAALKRKQFGKTPQGEALGSLLKDDDFDVQQQGRELRGTLGVDRVHSYSRTGMMLPRRSPNKTQVSRKGLLGRLGLSKSVQEKPDKLLRPSGTFSGGNSDRWAAVQKRDRLDDSATERMRRMRAIGDETDISPWQKGGAPTWMRTSWDRQKNMRRRNHTTPKTIKQVMGQRRRINRKRVAAGKPPIDWSKM